MAKLSYFVAAITLLLASMAQAQDGVFDMGQLTGTLAQDHNTESERARACRVRYGARATRCARSQTSSYERWRNRPGKRDCGAYNWKCPARPRDPAVIRHRPVGANSSGPTSAQISACANLPRFRRQFGASSPKVLQLTRSCQNVGL